MREGTKGGGSDHNKKAAADKELQLRLLMKRDLTDPDSSGGCLLLLWRTDGMQMIESTGSDDLASSPPSSRD